MNNLFDDKGRRIPFSGMRVFNETCKWYYQLKQPEINYLSILERSQKYSEVPLTIKLNDFEGKCLELMDQIQNDQILKNLFAGVHVPFIAPMATKQKDIGLILEKSLLPSVAKSFTNKFPNLHCKAILQGSSKLEGELKINKQSRYQNLLNAQKKGPIVGWYFPQVLQEYDQNSQRKQMETLPNITNVCLSGHVDIASVIVGTPDLLIHEEKYPPVLCLSAVQHNDPKLMLCFKAYGHHLEFWCMSQMLTPDVIQVSEQWSGGLTLFSNI